jgi:hypothetical protein
MENQQIENSAIINGDKNKINSGNEPRQENVLDLKSSTKINSKPDPNKLPRALVKSIFTKSGGVVTSEGEKLPSRRTININGTTIMDAIDYILEIIGLIFLCILFLVFYYSY